MKKESSKTTIQDVINSQDWKNKNEDYLKQLQKFLDLADNIENDNLKKSVINQMLKCDETLTKIIQEICRNECDNK